MYCSNCEEALDDQIESDGFEIDEEEVMGKHNNTPQLVTIQQAVSLIFNKNVYNQTMSVPVPGLGMCQDCIQVLSELYILFTRFKKRTTTTSHLQQLLTNEMSADYDTVTDVIRDTQDTTTVKEEELEHTIESDKEWILPNLPHESDEWNNDDDYELPSHLLRNKPRPRLLYNSRTKKSKTKLDETPGGVKKIKSEFTRRSTRIAFNQSKIEKSPFPTLKLVKLPSTLIVPDKVEEYDQNPSKFEPKKGRKPDRRVRPNRIRSKSTKNPPPIPLECDYGCQERFKTRKRLALHLKLVHNEIRKFECTLCPRKYAKRTVLEEHMKAKHLGFSIEDQERNRCPVCEKVCNSKGRLTHHLNRYHVAHEAGECVECKKIFQNRFAFEGHLDRHAAEKEDRVRQHSCPDCGASFFHNSRLQRHIDIVHLKKMKFACDQCPYKTNYPSSLREHQRSHVPNRERSFPCNICDAKFYSPQVARSHMRTHQPNGQNCLCNYCGLSTTTPASLQRHVRSKHFDIPEVAQTATVFPCTICGKEFKLKYHLIQHLQSKTHGGPGFRQKQ